MRLKREKRNIEEIENNLLLLHIISRKNLVSGQILISG